MTGVQPPHPKFRGVETPPTPPPVWRPCLQLSTAVNKQYPDEALGAQKLHQVWKIYVRTPRTRAGLIVSGLHLDRVVIDVFNVNPIVNTNKQSERVVGVIRHGHRTADVGLCEAYNHD